MDSAGTKKPLIGASRTDQHLDFSGTAGTAPFIGVTILIDINTPIHITTFKHHAQKLFLFVIILGHTTLMKIQSNVRTTSLF